MKTFKQFLFDLEESCNFPVVSIDKQKVNLNDSETLSELNKHLSVVLSVGFVNAYQAFEKAKKVLSMYSVELSTLEKEPDWSAEKGTIKIPFVVKNPSGENLSGSFKLDMDSTENFFFVLNYSRENGIYIAKAEVFKK